VHSGGKAGRPPCPKAKGVPAALALEIAGVGVRRVRHVSCPACDRWRGDERSSRCARTLLHLLTSAIGASPTMCSSARRSAICRTSERHPTSASVRNRRNLVAPAGPGEGPESTHCIPSRRRPRMAASEREGDGAATSLNVGFPIENPTYVVASGGRSWSQAPTAGLRSLTGPCWRVRHRQPCADSRPSCPHPEWEVRPLKSHC
jgi:hypothetical protein